MSINVIVFHGNGCSACHEEMEFLEREKIHSSRETFRPISEHVPN